MRTATTTTRSPAPDIRCGDTVLVVVAAANRDPAVFDQPDQFRLDRTGPAPLSFGYGAHYCLGAALAQLERQRCDDPKSIARQPVLAGRCIWRDARPSAARSQRAHRLRGTVTRTRKKE